MDDKVGGSVDTKARRPDSSFASVIFGTYMSEIWLPNEVNVHRSEIRTGAENSHVPPKLTSLPTGRARRDAAQPTREEPRRPASTNAGGAPPACLNPRGRSGRFVTGTAQNVI